MTVHLKADDYNSHVFTAIRAAAKAEKYAGGPGIRAWAKEHYNAKINIGDYGEITSIKFPDSETLAQLCEDLDIPPRIEPPNEVVADMLGQKFTVGDYVVMHNNIYVVLKTFLHYGDGCVNMILVKKSRTTKPVNRRASECCVLDKNAVLIWMLKD